MPNLPTHSHCLAWGTCVSRYEAATNDNTTVLDYDNDTLKKNDDGNGEKNDIFVMFCIDMLSTKEEMSTTATTLTTA
jgi:hypothetical protein